MPTLLYPRYFPSLQWLLKMPFWLYFSQCLSQHQELGNFRKSISCAGSESSWQHVRHPEVEIAYNS